MSFSLPMPDDFDFRRAVCSHGWFVLAPNRWDPLSASLETVIPLDRTRAVRVRVRQERRRLVIEAGKVSAAHAETVRACVRRMLRLDENLSAFHILCRQFESHHAAGDARFGRLLRAPSLFEDIVKVMCTCNVAWRQTVNMVERLVSRWGNPVDPPGQTARSFPTAASLARAQPLELRTLARLGYRAAFVSALARDVSEGRVDLQQFERFKGPTSEMQRFLRRIHGIGPYAASNLCMLLGRYDCLAIDTELMRFLTERHPRRRFTPASIRRCYEKWHPYQFLAYWWELWNGYEQRHGPAHTWDVARVGHAITGESRRRSGPAGQV
jgi:3-methyladenine DNA glycosylase/8-oxoguanine DNA glycosylase